MGKIEVAIVNHQQSETIMSSTSTYNIETNLIEHNSDRNTNQTIMNGFIVSPIENSDQNEASEQKCTTVSSGQTRSTRFKSTKHIYPDMIPNHLISAHSKVKQSRKKAKKYNDNDYNKGKINQHTVAKRKGRPQKNFGSGTIPSASNKKTFNDSTMNNYYNSNKKQRDPFLLVDYHQFSNDLMPPFRVKIKLDALALMDLHAHCVHTEVIGCLGGFYCRVTRTLHVLVAEPCFSIDDHETKCEMDPVSQALALDKLERKNFQMVGWYHSHPTFMPNPSLRDIDTQNYYQKIFTNHPNNGNLKESQEYKQRIGSAKENNEQTDGPDSNNDLSSFTIQNGSQCANRNREPKDNDGEWESHPFVAFIISPFIIPTKETINTSLTSKSFTRYEPIVDYPIDAKFYANNTIYSYHHRYNTSYRYFTHELNSVLASPVKCFWVGDSKYSKSQLTSKQKNRLIPYEIEIHMIRDENFIPSITNRLSEMCQWLFQDHSKTKSVVDLLKRYTRIGSINVTYLEKMIASLSHHLQNPSVLHLCTEYECERIRIECVSILMQELIENRESKELNKRLNK